jgi:hypothetical protein
LYFFGDMLHILAKRKRTSTGGGDDNNRPGTSRGRKGPKPSEMKKKRSEWKS